MKKKIIESLQPNPEYVRELCRMVDTSPFPEHMAMKLVSIEPDKAVIELTPDRCHLQLFGIVHGGVLATLIDTATFWSVFMRIPEDAGLVNIDLKLNYLRSVTNQKLKAEARAIRSGNTLSYAECHVFDSGGQTVAHGTSTLMTLPGKGLKLSCKKFLAV
jgi:uncharacterized protein (TIGR00369 family)